MELRQLTTACNNFFAKRAKYPQFKSKKHSKQCFAIPQNIFIKKDIKRIVIPKFQEGIQIKIHKELPRESIIKQAFISRNADNYSISLCYEENKSISKIIEVNNAVGLDISLDITN